MMPLPPRVNASDDCLHTVFVAPQAWCNRQWQILLGGEAGCMELVFRIATVALLIIATAGAALLSSMGNCVISDSEQAEGERVSSQQSPVLQRPTTSVVVPPLQLAIAKPVQTTLEQDFNALSYGPAIPNKPEAPYKAALENMKLNRYQDILPYDSNRFASKFDEKFYFNASWILGGRFLVSHAPIKETLGDFWRVAFESNCSAVVMLTNFEENGAPKSDQYWPSKEGEETRYEMSSALPDGEKSISVRMESEMQAEVLNGREIWIREFNGTMQGKKYEVTQFHLVNWPDFGVVETDVLATLISMVNGLQKKHQKRPLLVHCSAGIGRSGAFIASMEAASRYKRGGASTQQLLKEVVTEMRDNVNGRDGMVARQEQYQLAFDTINLLVKA